MKVRKFLHAHGFRFTLHDSTLPGSPDLVLPGRRVVVFVHGCFWHRHECKAATMPKTRTDFWTAKFEANKTRDLKNFEALRAAGWHPITIWECDIKNGSFQVPLLQFLATMPVAGRRRRKAARA